MVQPWRLFWGAVCLSSLLVPWVMEMVSWLRPGAHLALLIFVRGNA